MKTQPGLRPGLSCLFFYRLLGGGPKEVGQHEAKPCLNTMFRDFKSRSKGLFKICGHPEVDQTVGPHRSKAFILASYGILSHVSAVRAELCLDSNVAEKIHPMLLSLRAIKLGPERGKLRASACPLPRLEPWANILAQYPHTLTMMMEAKRAREAIFSRGERGDGRDVRPNHFELSCPTCAHSKDCARIVLYTTAARSLVCINCKRNTTSTKYVFTAVHGITALLIEKGALGAVKGPPIIALIKGPAPLRPSSVSSIRPKG